VHELLERVDFKRPVIPSAEAIKAEAGAASDDIAALLQGFTESELFQRLGRARGVRREQPFGFLLGRTMITGVLDLIAGEPADGGPAAAGRREIEAARPSRVPRLRGRGGPVAVRLGCDYAGGR